jgi:hypothetical protein
MRLPTIFVILVLLSNSLFSQSISVKSEIAIVNLPNVRVTGGFLKVDSIPDHLEGMVLTTIDVTTTVKDISVEVTDIKRNRIAVRKADETGKSFYITATGEVWIRAKGIDFDTKTFLDEEVSVNIKPLTPPKPVDPIVPPVPDADVPIKEPGFRVLVTYDSALGVPDNVNAKVVRQYLFDHCVRSPDGKNVEYRIWDIAVPTTNAPKLWQDAFARPKKSIPWILISNGKTGFEGPLPNTTDELLTLLKKYGN